MIPVRQEDLRFSSFWRVQHSLENLGAFFFVARLT